MKPREIIDREVARLEALAPAGYFLALRVRGASPLMVFKTFPQDWLDTYMENGYMMRDPVTTWALTVGGTIRWSSRLLPDPFGILRQAADYGLKYGASIAHGPVKSLSICSICRNDREPEKAEIEEARQIVLRLHELTDIPTALTADQTAVLAALAAGEDARLAERLNISEAAARTRLRDLCETFFVATPAEALKRARDGKLV